MGDFEVFVTVVDVAYSLEIYLPFRCGGRHGCSGMSLLFWREVRAGGAEMKLNYRGRRAKSL